MCQRQLVRCPYYFNNFLRRWSLKCFISPYSIQKSVLLLSPHGKTIEEWVELGERTFNFARYAKTWFVKGDMETRRAIFASLGSHLIIKDQKLNVELHPYFKVIFENLEDAEKELLKVRTSESVVNKRQIAEILANCPTLRGH